MQVWSLHFTICDSCVCLESNFTIMVFSVQLTSNFYYYSNPRAILVSGNQIISKSSCVLFELYYSEGVSLSVRVPKCVYTADKFGTLLLITDGLGSAWHNLWLPLEVYEKCDVQLQFEVIYDISYAMDTKISIGNILLFDNSCMAGL